MNVLIVNSYFEGGGAEKIARQLYYGLMVQENINVFFLCGRAENKNKYESIYVKGDINYSANRFLCAMENNQRIRDRYATRRIIRLIKEKRIDIVHFHNIHGNYMGIRDVEKISRYCRIVWTLHDMWALTGHCAYALRCNKWQAEECNSCTQYDLYPKIRMNVSHNRYLEKKKAFANRNIMFVTPSKWLYEECGKSYLKGEKLNLIHNGVNTKVYREQDKKELRKKYGIDEQKIVLMFAASQLNNPYKGIQTLVSALENVKNKSRYALLICGKGDSLPINKEYIIYNMGYIEDDIKMSELYALSDVFILPSVAENFPCTILESMACGTPVIASRVGGVAEQIDEHTGWMFDVGDRGQLKVIIERFQRDEGLCKAMANRCREKIINMYSEEKMLQEYKKLYASIMKEYCRD